MKTEYKFLSQICFFFFAMDPTEIENKITLKKKKIENKNKKKH